MFMRQTLEADASCQKAVNGWAAQRAADGLSACSVRTGAYCKARLRLPLEMVTALTRETGRLLSRKALPAWQWRGRAVKLVDGTGLSMPDTPENQAAYRQPNTQAPGVGFPLARLRCPIPQPRGLFACAMPAARAARAMPRCVRCAWHCVH